MADRLSYPPCYDRGMSVDSPSYSDSTSGSLIRKVQADDSDAWDRLTLAYGPVVYGWARRANLRPDDAADVAQEVFQSLVKSIKNFRRRNPTDSFRGWLWTITRNKIRDHFRRCPGIDEATGGTGGLRVLEQLEAEPPSATSVFGRSEQAGIRQRVLEQLKSRTTTRIWDAFYRTAVDGDSPADVAEDLGMTVWAVYKARARILKRLREELEDLL